MNQVIALIGRTAAVAFLCAGAVAAPLTSPPRVLVRSIAAQADGIALSVGVAADDGDPNTCSTDPSASVAIGSTVKFCYTVTNNSDRALNYHTLVDDVDGTIFSLMPHTLTVGDSFRFERTMVVRADSGTHTVTWTAQDYAPGYSSREGQRNFIDLRTGAGTALAPADDGAAQVTLPFAFPFYDGSSTVLSIGNNGGIIVADTEQSIPSFEFPLPYVNPFGGLDGGLILPYWDDLGDAAGDVYWAVLGNAPSRYVVVQWDRPHFGFYDGTHRLNVEAVLGEDGSISFQYMNTVFANPDDPDWDNAGSATIGLQNADGTIGNQFSFDQASLNPPQAIEWFVTSPTLYSASGSAQIVPLQPATVSVTPNPVVAIADAGAAPVSASVTLANGGQVALDWTLTRAAGGTSAQTIVNGHAGTSALPVADKSRAHFDPRSSFRASVPRTVAVLASETQGCDASTPGIQIQDDGTAEDGYTDAPFDVTYAQAGFVQRYTPPTYPALISSVCAAFLSAGPTDQDFNIIVVDDSGFDGTPGQVIAIVPAHAANIPTFGTQFVRVDLSGLGISVASGSVYIGVSFDPTHPGDVFIAADTTGTPNPDGYDGHAFEWPGDFISWSQLIDPGVGFPDFHSLLVRPVFEPDYCASPSDVPWLSVDKTSGHVDAQSQAALTLTFDPAGLGNGEHDATLCIDSNDPSQPHLVVPVRFVIGDRVFSDGFDSP